MSSGWKMTPDTFSLTRKDANARAWRARVFGSPDETSAKSSAYLFSCASLEISLTIGGKNSEYTTPGTISPILRDAADLVTKVPRPCCRVTSPSRSRSLTTIVIVDRLTSKRPASAASLGKRNDFE